MITTMPFMMCIDNLHYLQDRMIYLVGEQLLMASIYIPTLVNVSKYVQIMDGRGLTLLDCDSFKNQFWTLKTLNIK